MKNMLLKCAENSHTDQRKCYLFDQATCQSCSLQFGLFHWASFQEFLFTITSTCKPKLCQSKAQHKRNYLVSAEGRYLIQLPCFLFGVGRCPLKRDNFKGNKQLATAKGNSLLLGVSTWRLSA